MYRRRRRRTARQGNEMKNGLADDAGGSENSIVKQIAVFPNIPLYWRTKSMSEMGKQHSLVGVAS